MIDTIKAYDAGSADLNSTGVKVEIELEVRQLLIYPTVDSFVSLNDSITKEIFLPKGMWTPISISRNFACSNFVVKSEEAGKIYWQGWVI